jgi:putative DNA primase/helicase
MSLLHNHKRFDYSKKQPLTSEDIRRIAFSLGKAHPYRDGYTCCCPAHEDSNPSLSIWLSDKYQLGLKCYVKCKPGDIYNEIKSLGLLPQSTMQDSWHQNSYETTKKFSSVDSYDAQTSLSAKPAKVAKALQDFKNQERALAIWNESKEIACTIVETYLRSRKITASIDHSALRYHTRLWDEQKYFPGMIGAIKRWPSNDAVAIHRTFLKPDGSGKANILRPKKMLGPVTGGAVRFGNDLSHIIVAEGIETALSIYQETGITTWAALSSNNIPTLILPPLEITALITIALDNDSAGIECAEQASKYWIAAGRTVKWSLPPKGLDFNDILREMGDEHAT